MRKVVSTEMSNDSVTVLISTYSPDGGSPDQTCTFRFPMSVVNPRVALQVATLLVSDPTIPSTDEKEG